MGDYGRYAGRRAASPPLRRHCWHWLAGLLLCSWGMAIAATDSAPASLAQWRDWVLQDADYLDCPQRHDRSEDTAESGRHCQFAGPLRLELESDVGRFNMEWRVYRAGWVSLPGFEQAWPFAVLVDGQPTPVQARHGWAQVWLNPGLRRISGELRWVERPQALSIPEAITRIELTLDGAAVATPDRRDGSLWLGSREAAARESDTLQVEVYRLLSDGNPALLETRLQLSVTGRARELRLGPVLPDGFVAMHLAGDLPQRLEADGRLHLQLAPGQHEIVIEARATDRLERIVRPVASEPWPAQEIWSFESDPRLPPTEVMEAEAVDPAQAGVPSRWQAYAAFALNVEQGLRLQRSDLARTAAAPNRLTLARELWLDFDGGGWTAIDRLRGEMRQGWRLDAGPALPLQRAESGGESLLLTRSPGGEDIGVEWRRGQVDLLGSARLPGGSNLPASGWRETLDSANLQLNLPPGYQLLAATGSDRAPSAWVARWRLGQIFLLCLGVLLAWRLGGWRLALPAALYLLLSGGQRGAPLFSLLLLLLCLLGLRWLSAEGPRRWIRRLAWPVLVVLLLIGLPYAAEQFRLLLHPQLERGSVASSGDFNLATAQVIQRSGRYVSYGDDSAKEAGNVMALAPAAPADEEREVLTAVSSPNVQQAQQKRLLKPLNRIDPNAVVQAGQAEPQWRWNTHQISVAGPVASDHRVGLWLTPPWITAVWRLLAVLTLGWLVAAALLQLLQRPLAGRWQRWLALALCLPGLAMASEFPSESLLQSYRERLLTAPECAPTCVNLQQVNLQADATRLRLQLELHLQAPLSVPLPWSNAWQAARVSVDGQPAPWLLGVEGKPWLPLSAGVRRVELEGPLLGERVALQFPLAAAAVQAQIDGWLLSGLDRGRIAAGELQLARLAPVESAGGSRLQPAELPPYVSVTRTLTIDLDWTLLTEVHRLAPFEGALQVQVPLLEGERVLSDDPPVVDGRVQVSLAEGVSDLSWQSRLDPVSALQWQAPPLAERVEFWVLQISPIFHVEYEGPAALLLAAEGDGTERRFSPLPGDRLTLEVQRPAAVDGSTLAIDGVGIRSRYGTRLRETELNLQWRATRGGQHALQLPPEAELLWLRIDGRDVGLQPEAGRLLLPVRPGQQSVALALREPVEQMLSTGFAQVDLGLPSANLGMALNLPADRWLLWTQGPAIGPAVRFWSVLALVVVLAVLVGRSGRTALGTREMLILGIGLATVAWWTLLLVAGWLLLLDWRRRRGRVGSALAFDSLQVFLVGLSVVVLFALIGTAWAGLLGQPAMRVEGNGSSPQDLIWFADHAAGPLPSAWAISVPLWVYKVAILLWSLWLANAVVRWFKLALDALGSGGWWQSPLFPPRAKRVPVAPTTPTAPAEAPQPPAST